jgi:hypothetical protein
MKMSECKAGLRVMTMTDGTGTVEPTPKKAWYARSLVRVKLDKKAVFMGDEVDEILYRPNILNVVA